MPDAFQTSVCYEGGLLGYFITWWFAAWLPLFQWWSLYGRLGDRDLRFYFLVYYNTYVPTWFLAILLRDVVIRVAPPNPLCSTLTYSRFSLEAVLLGQYYAQGFFHHIQFGLPITWRMVLRVVITTSLVLGLLAWSGFYWLTDLLGGYGVGMVCGAFFGYHLHDVWVPRFSLFAGSPLFARYFDCTFAKGPMAEEDREKWFVL